MKLAPTLLLAGLIVGCVGSYQAPQSYTFEKEREYQKPFEEVWTKVVEYFATNSTPVKTIEKASGFIASDFNLTLDTLVPYCDCGATKVGVYDVPRLADPMGNFNVLVKSLSENRTRVLVTTSFKARMYGGQQGASDYGTVTCNSKGYLEKNLLEYISR